MLSIIICEGTTDLVLLQYFLEKAFNWQYIKDSELRNYSKINIQVGTKQHYKWFKKNNDFLCIKASGGCSKLMNSLDSILEINSMELNNIFKNIVILTDNDEVDTSSTILNDITNKFNDFGIEFKSSIINNEWNETTFVNAIQESESINLLPLIIPFNENGAIETFLLNAIKNNSVSNDPNSVDKLVIDQCIDFIDNIDCKNKYLQHRREKTKAKFDTVFVVMTPATAFSERQSLLRNIPWEQYQSIQESFKKLSHLG